MDRTIALNDIEGFHDKKELDPKFNAKILKTI